jgi:hypothetical protein
MHFPTRQLISLGSLKPRLLYPKWPPLVLYYFNIRGQIFQGQVDRALPASYAHFVHTQIFNQHFHQALPYSQLWPFRYPFNPFGSPASLIMVMPDFKF